MQVLQDKLDKDQCDYALIDTIEANGEHIAELSDELTDIVTDREDRKWVACAISSQDMYGESPPIVYAAETDWFVIEAALEEFGITFKRLLPNASAATPSRHTD